MQKKGYALKRSLGLVPHEYRRDERFHQGAHKNWPRSVNHNEQMKMAYRETPSNNGYVRGHQFVG